MLWIQATAFALGSLALLGISWRALKNTRSHGFYRFFAWEAMLGLLVLNAPVWFEDRYALHQKISWLLLFTSLGVLLLGIYQLRRDGKPGEQRQDDELYAFERTSQLVTGGIYRFIRHPPSAVLLAAVADLGHCLQGFAPRHPGAGATGQRAAVPGGAAR